MQTNQTIVPAVNATKNDAHLSYIRAAIPKTLPVTVTPAICTREELGLSKIPMAGHAQRQVMLKGLRTQYYAAMEPGSAV